MQQLSLHEAGFALPRNRNYKEMLPTLCFSFHCWTRDVPSSFPSARANGTATALPICRIFCPGMSAS